MTEEERKAARRKYRAKWRMENRERVKEYARKWSANHREEKRRTARVWRANHKDAFKEYYKKYYMKNRTTKRAKEREWREKHRHEISASYKKGQEALSDPYMKQILAARTALKTKDIPQSLIDAKRSHLKLLRLIKEQENGQCAKENQ